MVTFGQNEMSLSRDLQLKLGEASDVTGLDAKNTIMAGVQSMKRELEEREFIESMYKLTRLDRRNEPVE
jgi:hypothetical protein